jgi:acyl-CoA reductase-like NAD-dependent aldehyde dehydrogenase
MSDTLQGELYIDGEFRPSENERYFDVVDPCDESLVGRASEAATAVISLPEARTRRR